MSGITVDSLNMNPQEAVRFMKICKECGNECVQKRDYEEASKSYEAGLAAYYGIPPLRSDELLKQEIGLLFCQLATNQSKCLYELDRCEESRDLAWIVTQINPNWWKGYYRGSVANAKLGQRMEAMMAILHCYEVCHPLPAMEPCCQLIMAAMTAGILCSVDDNRKTKNNWNSEWAQVIRLVKDEQQWKYIVEHLVQDQEWKVICRILLVDQPQGMGKYAENIVLADLMELAMEGESCCDELIGPLIAAGADPETLSTNGELPIFAALSIGLTSGRFLHLQHLLKQVDESSQLKEWINHQGETLLTVAEKAEVSSEVKAKAISMLTYQGINDKSRWEIAYENASSKGTKCLLQDLNDHIDEGEFDDAVIVLRELLTRTDVVKKDLYLKRCKIYMEQKKYQSAKNDANSVLEYDNKCLEAHRILRDIEELKASMDCYIREQLIIYHLSQDIEEKNDVLFRVACTIKRIPDYALMISQQFNPNLESWSRLILRMFTDQRWRALVRLLTTDIDEQGELARYRAGQEIQLYRLLIPKVSFRKKAPNWDRLLSIAILLLERGADVRSFFPDRHASLRPVSAIFILAIQSGPTLLDYLIDRGDLDRESGYPRSDCAIHQYLKAYRQLNGYNRFIRLCRLRKELKLVELGQKTVPPWVQYQKQLSNPRSPKGEFLFKEAGKLLNIYQ